METIGISAALSHPESLLPKIGLRTRNGRTDSVAASRPTNQSCCDGSRD